jgi:pSer/pThr/pTyr-binding forkhead associated (FHA) protein
MFDLNSQVDCLPNSQGAAGNPPDLDQRLGLYQVFLKLYEHHRELLDEILDLENTSDRHRLRSVWQYMQGVVNGDQAYLTTNLLQDHTEIVTQPQNLWTIGRDRKASLPILDKRLSRRHALIQYVPGKGFSLIDLNSTNGTYINSEPVRRPVLLKDGDRIRLGSLSFIFFVCDRSRQADPIPPELLAGINLVSAGSQTSSPKEAPVTGETDQALEANNPDWDTPLQGNEKETSMFLKPIARHQEKVPQPSDPPQLSPAQQSDILDRFLNR